MLYVSGEQGRLSERRDRYFSCACCRRIWHLLADEASRTAVRAAEEYLDGLVTLEDLDTASRAAAAPGGFAGDAAAAAASPRRGLDRVSVRWMLGDQPLPEDVDPWTLGDGPPGSLAYPNGATLLGPY